MSWRGFWRRLGRISMALRHSVTWTLTSLSGWVSPSWSKTLLELVSLHLLLIGIPRRERWELAPEILVIFFFFSLWNWLSSCRWLETGGWRLSPSYSTKLPFSSFMSGRMWLYRLRDYFSLPCMNIHPKSLSHNACVSLAFGHDYHTFTHAPLSAPTGALVVMMCYYYISAAAGHFFEFSHWIVFISGSQHDGNWRRGSLDLLRWTATKEKDKIQCISPSVVRSSLRGWICSSFCYYFLS